MFTQILKWCEKFFLISGLGFWNTLSRDKDLRRDKDFYVNNIRTFTQILLIDCEIFLK